MSPPSSSRPLWAALFSVLLLSIVVAPAHAQDTRAPTALTLSGRVVDADTQAPLPQANLRI
ncbi:hypothetical protein, partial [Salinibacter altiplanensis]